MVWWLVEKLVIIKFYNMDGTLGDLDKDDYRGSNHI